ncbi:MAG: ubiquinone-binding protein [Alphaproteobacteria bacterium 64-6]|nr:type II toxin-antitoxin system RatA family toxin [Hyphomicrobium sp.]OJU22687.1 MAG: ubiquinone-binding protein [Alphaproteobacteria bacterium 64-6]
MPSFETRRQVPFTTHEMFDLVADVERYPEFLPLCEGLRVLSRDGDGEQRTLVAAMEVGYKGIRETFTSRVTLDGSAPSVRTDLVEGPFTKLINRWGFVDKPGGCEVTFFIDYEFKSMLLQMLVGGLFQQAFGRFAEAFEERAHAIYGRRVSSA